MKINLLLFLSIIIILSACKRDQISAASDQSTAADSLKGYDEKHIRSIGETLSPDAIKKVSSWPEYKQLDDLITNFYSITTNEALTLSKELTNATGQLKDSIKIERFKQADIAIRINVLHNYALRLADMATLEYIDPKEVKLETQNILDAFSALNAKLNNIYDQQKLETELKEFKNQ